MKVALIPARGGSKRIPGKNIRDFFGKPIIAYTIEAALQSNSFDEVIVSTDDRDIADIARQYGASVPFIRPSAVSDDHSTIADVLMHAADWYQNQGSKLSILACLYATAPFLRIEDIVGAMALMTRQDGPDAVLAVTSFPFPIQRALALDMENKISMVHEHHRNTRSQDLPERYYDAGQFYMCDARLLGAKNLQPVAWKIPRIRVQDIDTPEDWQTAEHLYKALKEAK